MYILSLKSGNSIHCTNLRLSVIIQLHITCCAIFCNISKINSLRENGCIVINVLEVDLHISITNKALSTLILSEYCKSPLWSAKGLIPIQRLQTQNIYTCIIMELLYYTSTLCKNIFLEREKKKNCHSRTSQILTRKKIQEDIWYLKVLHVRCSIFCTIRQKWYGWSDHRRWDMQDM